MAEEEHMSDRQRAADLSTRIRELEAELGAARATLTAVQSRMQAQPEAAASGGGAGDGNGGRPFMPGKVHTAMPAPFSALPVSDVSAASHRAAAPFILLEPLPMHDALRRKWELGAGLPPADGSVPELVAAGNPASPLRTDGYLRLFGLLPDGQPWEKILPFAQLSRTGGLTVGRDAASCDIVMPETSVSRCHARLELGPQGLSITDLKSTNGLFVNEERLEPYRPCAPLADGMTLGLGETILRIEIAQTS